MLRASFTFVFECTKQLALTHYNKKHTVLTYITNIFYMPITKNNESGGVFMHHSLM